MVLVFFKFNCYLRFQRCLKKGYPFESTVKHIRIFKHTKNKDKGKFPPRHVESSDGLEEVDETKDEEEPSYLYSGIMPANEHLPYGRRKHAQSRVFARAGLCQSR